MRAAASKVTEDIHRPLLVAESGTRAVLRHGAIESVAALAAVDFDVFAHLLNDIFARRVPAFEMPDAKLSLGVFLIAGPLARFLLFDLDGFSAQQGTSTTSVLLCQLSAASSRHPALRQHLQAAKPCEALPTAAMSFYPKIPQDVQDAECNRLIADSASVFHLH